MRLDEPITGNNLGSTASPTQPTSYSYSVLGNLLTVTQGVQTRTFTYDSLSRLRTAVNPESGTISYQYDDNSNLTQKSDARSITTTFTYDALNRPTLKNYSETTPDVAYFYDTQTLPAGAPAFDRGYAKGRLVGVTYGGGSAGTYHGYDARGSVLRQYQQTDAVNYLTEAAYSLSGSMQSQTYPSVPGAGDRRTVSYTNDSAGRLASLSSSATSYAPAASVSSIGYSAPGGLSSETYGNNLIHGVTYNSRLQTNEIKLGTSGAPASNVSITYNYGTTANNGNLQSTSYAGGGLSYTQTFGYDELNRLTTSQEGASWSQTNSYDRYGNRSTVGGVLTFSVSNNRITTAGYAYDAVGNLTNDTAHSYNFDAENKISKVDGVSAYVYDGDGQRVRKLVNENLRFIYGVGGQQIAEFSGANGALKKEYIYGASGLVATIEPTAVNASGTRYTTSDHLSSPRLVTNSSAAVVSRHDYMPFGEELFNGGRTFGMGYGTSDGLRQKFTSYERDNETGLDFAQARYYATQQGRFTTPDPLLSSGTPADPKSWNRYSYCLNTPTKYVDPNGLIWQTRTTVKDNVSTTEYKWVWQDDPEAGWGKVTNFWVDITASDGSTVGLRMNPNGPMPTAALLYARGLEMMGGPLFGPSQAAVNGYEITANSAERALSSSLGAVDSMPNQAFSVGTTFAGIRGIGLGSGTRMAEGLIGVPEASLNRAAARLYGMRVGDRPLVNSIEAFGSRAGSTFRGRGPGPGSDLDLFVDMHPSLRWGRSSGWVDRTLGSIQSDFQREAGFKLDLRETMRGVQGSPLVPIKKP